MVQIIKKAMPSNQVSRKCPYSMKPTRIIVHNTANDASAQNEIAYMQRNNSSTSFHFAVDDKEIVQGIELNRNSWNCGDGTNGTGNRQGISIEICYSKSGGDRFIKAEQNTVDLIVKLLKEYGWGIKQITKHQDYNGKYCPHRTLDMGWERFLNMIREKLGESGKKPTTSKKIDVTYRARANGRWLPEVKNLNDYAGNIGQAITDIAVKVSDGEVKYRVHSKGRWLPWVTGYDMKDSKNGYAGNKTPIDGVQVYFSTPDDVRPYQQAYYRVSELNKGYFAWQEDTSTKNGMDGYAGNADGTAIDRFQIQIKER